MLHLPQLQGESDIVDVDEKIWGGGVVGWQIEPILLCNLHTIICVCSLPFKIANHDC